MRPFRSRALVLYAALLSTVSACRCKSEEPGKVSKHKAETAAAKPDPVEPDLTTLLRCGDFLTAADVTALGLDASKYKPDFRQPNEGLGVTCIVGKLQVSIFHGTSFDSMRDGALNAVAQGMIEKQDGPKIGRETLWTALQQADTVTFLSTNGRYAANISGSGTGAEIIEKVARTVEGHMNEQR